MEEPQNPYAEIQEPENKPSSDANETRNEGAGSPCCAQVLVLLLFFIGLLILIVFSFLAQNDPRRQFAGTPLHMAVEEGDIEAVKKLLASGADINSMECKSKEAPLHRAVSGENTAMVELLIDSGADLYLRRKRDGKDPLAMAKSRELVEIEQLLRAKRTSISQ